TRSSSWCREVAGSTIRQAACRCRGGPRSWCLTARALSPSTASSRRCAAAQRTLASVTPQAFPRRAAPPVAVIHYPERWRFSFYPDCWVSSRFTSPLRRAAGGSLAKRTRPFGRRNSSDRRPDVEQRPQPVGQRLLGAVTRAAQRRL